MEESGSPYCGCLFFSANALARLLTELAESSFSVTGLSPSHAITLLTILKSPGIQPGEVARIMQLDPSTVTRFIEKLQGKGLVYRVQEGKMVKVFPTEQSTPLHQSIQDAWKNLFQSYSRIIGNDESKMLSKLTAEANSKLSRK